MNVTQQQRPRLAHTLWRRRFLLPLLLSGSACLLVVSVNGFSSPCCPAAIAGTARHHQPGLFFSSSRATTRFTSIGLKTASTQFGFHQNRRQQHHQQQSSSCCWKPQTVTTTSTSRMAVEGDFDPQAGGGSLEGSKGLQGRLFALYKFTRPHTIRGTILGSVAGTVRALVDTPGAIANAAWGRMLPRAFAGMFALLLGNAFIVGINQIYDRDIDQMNKPFLPVASGEMSKRFAWIAVVASGLAGPLVVRALFPSLLYRLYVVGLVLGAIYSVPPIRTKRNPILAGLTIATVRGFLLNFGVYYAVKDAVGAPFGWSPKVSFVARFMTIFATVIAVTKDLPDIEGDKAYQIETFATKVGVAKLSKCATVLLLANYVHAIVAGLIAAPGTFRLIPMLGGHSLLAALLVLRYRQLDPSSIPSIKQYYKHIWDLFYLEYGLYTLI